MTTTERVSMENLQGTTLGRYQLGPLLGRGNRASVYQATPQGGGQMNGGARESDLPADTSDFAEAGVASGGDDDIPF